jgi:hypothetical protein
MRCEIRREGAGEETAGGTALSSSDTAAALLLLLLLLLLRAGAHDAGRKLRRRCERGSSGGDEDGAPVRELAWPMVRGPSAWKARLWREGGGERVAEGVGGDRAVSPRTRGEGRR